MVDQALLDKKTKEHGLFEDEGEMVMSIIEILSKGKHANSMPKPRRWAMIMLIRKLVRLVNGSPDSKENWVDLENYLSFIRKSL